MPIITLIDEDSYMNPSNSSNYNQKDDDYENQRIESFCVSKQ